MKGQDHAVGLPVCASTSLGGCRGYVNGRWSSVTQAGNPAGSSFQVARCGSV